MSGRRLFHVALAATLILTTPARAGSPSASPAPTVLVDTVREIAKNVWVVPDDDLIPLVPNVGIVAGQASVLVIDTGLGLSNGAAVYALAKRLAAGRQILLTTTHFHPEHSLGASAFPRGSYIANEAQVREISEKSAALGKQFATFGPADRQALEGFKVLLPTRSYRGALRLDLGGRTVILREMPAHTAGDQIVEVPDAGVIFTGDLVEERSFPVLYDKDARGARWIGVLQRLRAMRPRILVPGHGRVADARLIAPQLGYLSVVQSRTREAVRSGLSQAEATRLLVPALGRLHPDWQFKDLIPYAVAIFYAEAAHRPPRMPGTDT